MPSESYAPRNFPGHPGDCIELGGIGECWGGVQGSSRGLTCEGHNGPIYRNEPTEADFARCREETRKADMENRLARQAMFAKWRISLSDEEWRDQRWTPETWDTHQANRWFRPFLDEPLPQPGPFWENLSTPVLCCCFSMVGEGIQVGDAGDDVIPHLQNLGRQAIAMVQKLRIPLPVGAYSLEIAPKWEGPIVWGWRDHPYNNPFPAKDLTLNLGVLSDMDLHLLYGCGAVVVDFSCLERGTRQVSMHVWHETEKELERRGIEPEFLMELKL